MADVWKSQPRKFCDVCRCWIADNKASISFHENGKRHKAAVQQKLSDIRYRGAAQDKKAKKEEEWVKQMERQAMQDYRDKDLLGGADITAKLFNEKKAERDAEKAAIQAAAAAAHAAAAAKAEEASTSSAAAGPSIGPTVESSGSGGPLKPVAAPKGGTKWHKQEKQWFEAKTEDGSTYFWHVETHESRWDAPKEGFFSIAEQEEVNKKHEEKERKKVETMYVSQAFHGVHREDAGLPTPSVGPQARANPYGEWQTVQPKAQKRQTSAVLDFQAPRKAERKSAVTLHNDKMLHFGTRATPSLGGEGYGDDNEDEKKPSITSFGFKKRKVDHRKNFRRRDDDE